MLVYHYDGALLMTVDIIICLDVIGLLFQVSSSFPFAASNDPRFCRSVWYLNAFGMRDEQHRTRVKLGALLSTETEIVEHRTAACPVDQVFFSSSLLCDGKCITVLGRRVGWPTLSTTLH